LIPLLIRAGLNKTALKVFGTDYPTRDGTCIRDYIHVTDLADAHLRAIPYLQKHAGVSVFNLGTESGTSVKEVIFAASKCLGTEIRYEEFPRRPGDAPVLVANSKKAQEVLGWRPNHSSIRQILQSVIDFEKKH
jgi:UDP-glucose 4-epimerase